jgi:hypothetical protein
VDKAAVASFGWSSCRKQKGDFMSDQIEAKRQAENLQVPSVDRVAVEPAEVAQEQTKWTLKGMLMMALCCGAPLLLILAITLFGISLAGVGGSLLFFVVLLACPLGMYFMMRMTNKK